MNWSSDCSCGKSGCGCGRQRRCDCTCEIGRKAKRREREIRVGRITIDCTPVRFETETEVETLVSCVDGGVRVPPMLVPFTPSLIPSVPMAMLAMDFLSTMGRQQPCPSCMM
jgi:hypothetical protein